MYNLPVRTDIAPLQRILVVEDESAVRFNLVSYLEDSGYQVEGSDNGSDALARIRQSTPDLVLSDLWMPGLNGLELVRTLHQEYPELPVIVVSGTGVLGDAVEALREGAWDFIAKPIPDMIVLEHAVVAALEKARLIRDNQHYQTQLEQVNHEMREYLQQLEEDAEAGRTMQMQLMPPASGVLGQYRFERCLLPSLHLSGDFVDYFSIDSDHQGFYLADVSGHGMSSALVTVLLCSFMRQLRESLRQDNDITLLDPALALTRLNSYLRQQQLDKYLTIFYGVIDTRSDLLHYCNGGQFPEPMLIGPTGGLFLAGKNLPLGLIDDVRYVANQTEFSAATTLLICSDGVLELLPENTLAQQKTRLLTAASDTPLSVDKLLTRLNIVPEQRYPDDVTLLIVHREVNHG